jgi:toxin ParE1/3/4
VTDAWLRERAEADLVENTRYYRLAGGDRLGERFFDAAIAALRAAERLPNAGSPRLGDLCEMPGLRSWRVKGFPLRWYYYVVDERLDDRLDVVRLLADAQDLTDQLGDDDVP